MIKKLWKYLVGLIIGVPLIALGFGATTELSLEKLSIATDDIIDDHTYVERKYDENKVLISEKEIVKYFYLTDEDRPMLTDEVLKLRTPSTATIALGGRKYVAKTTEPSFKVNGVWKKVKVATTTPEIYNRSTNTLTQRLIQTVYAANTGFVTAGTGSSDATVGSQAWASPTNLTSATLYSESSIDAASQFTEYAKGSNFGFAIPSSSTVDGIVARISKYYIEDFKSPTINDSSIRLFTAGTVAGDNKSVGTTWALDTVRTDTYGGAADSWGLTLDDGDINNSGFGVGFSATGTDSDDSVNYARNIQMDIYYTTALPGNPVIYDVQMKLGEIQLKSGTLQVK